jgi:signal transduction histidine kinase
MDRRYVIRIQDREGFERRVPLGNATVLGRQNHCDVVLSDEMVSRLHLRIDYVEGNCWAEDLGSSHGTFQDGVRIKRIMWKPGVILVLADGAYRLMLVPERVQGTESNMHAVLTTAQQLTGEYDLETLLQKSLDHLLRLSNQDRGFIMLSDGTDLEVFVQRNLIPNASDPFYISLSSVHQVFDTGEPVWVSDVLTNELISSQKSVIDLQLKTIYCLPLSVNGKRIGVVYLDSRQLKVEPVDRNAFEAIVGLCALAIERARLSEESQKHSALVELGTTTTNIVHEFKNALFSIGGHAELISSLCTDSEIHLHVKQIQASVDHLTVIGSDILDFSRTKHIVKKPHNLGRFLKKEIINWQVRAAKYDITIKGDGPECIALIEPSKIAIVIDNLFANSIEAIVASGTEGQIQLLWETAPNEVTIKVIDNGKGIPKNLQDKIFEPFFSYGKDKGAGLGMSTVKKIICGHGGTMNIDSETGTGTTIIIHLPIPSDQASMVALTGNTAEFLDADTLLPD